MLCYMFGLFNTLVWTSTHTPGLASRSYVPCIQCGRGETPLWDPQQHQNIFHLSSWGCRSDSTTS